MSTIKPNLVRVWASAAPGGNIVDPDVTTTDKFIDGWLAEVPPFEHFNFLQNLFTAALAHNNEQGTNVWDTDTTYPIGGVAKGSDGDLYIALVEQNGNDPVTDSGTNWRLAYLKAEDMPATAKEFGALDDGAMLYTTEIQAMFDDIDEAEGSDWWLKGRVGHVNAAKRITTAHFEDSVAGIIKFEDVDWSLNTTIESFGASRQVVWHINNISDGGTPVNEFRIHAPYHPGLVLDYKPPLSYAPFIQEAQGISGGEEFVSIVYNRDSYNIMQVFADTENAIFQWKTFPEYLSQSFLNPLSKVQAIDIITGNQTIQASTFDINEDVSLQVGEAIKIRSGAVAINDHTFPEPRLYLHNGNTGQRSHFGLASDDSFLAQEITGISQGSNLFTISNSVVFEKATASAPSATNAALQIGHNNVNSKSINATGTINASGADYAEYIKKSLNCGTILKGDICGINSDGHVTDKYDEAISFVVKSTNPNLVGGDTWGTNAPEKRSPEWFTWFDELQGMIKERPDMEAWNHEAWKKGHDHLMLIKPTKESDRVIDWKSKVQKLKAMKPEADTLMFETWNDKMSSLLSNDPQKVWKSQYKKVMTDEPDIDFENHKDWFARVEAFQQTQPTESSEEWKTWAEVSEVERQKYDRIAFSGIAPANCTAIVGDHVLPFRENDGSISGFAISDDDISFQDYKRSVGRVWYIDSETSIPVLCIKVS